MTFKKTWALQVFFLNGSLPIFCGISAGFPTAICPVPGLSKESNDLESSFYEY